jgi:microsomal epoxide hydrolase
MLMSRTEFLVLGSKMPESTGWVHTIGNLYEDLYCLDMQNNLTDAGHRRRTEERINSFGNFKATLVDEHGAASEMHFITLRSQKPNAIPVVLLHGWPGSPLEFLDMLDLLRDRYTSEELPYTIIVPSLPGYGFSSGPSLQTPSSSDTIAYAVNQLMVGLGHGEGYIAHGGDIGSLVARVLAAKYPACEAAHGTFQILIVLA